MTLLLVLARAVHFGSGMILLSVLVFRWTIMRTGAMEEAPFLRRLQRLLPWALLANVVSGAVWFWTVAAEMNDVPLRGVFDWKIIRDTILETQFGRIALLRLSVTFGLAVAMWFLARKEWFRQRRLSGLGRLAILLAATLLVTLAGMGHAAAGVGWSAPWQLLADGIHLLAAAVWPAALLPLGIYLRFAFQAGSPALLREAVETTRCFSAVSLGAVTALVLSGFVNSCFLVGSVQALVDSDYGRILLVKLFLFVCMIGVGTWNRFYLIPRLPVAPELDDAVPNLVARLRRNVMAEVCLAVGVLLVVGLLGMIAPARP